MNTPKQDELNQKSNCNNFHCFKCMSKQDKIIRGQKVRIDELNEELDKYKSYCISLLRQLGFLQKPSCVCSRLEIKEQKAKIAELERKLISPDCEGIHIFPSDIEAQNNKIASLEEKLRIAVEALKYCALDPGYLRPESNSQNARAFNALNEISGSSKKE